MSRNFELLSKSLTSESLAKTNPVLVPEIADRGHRWSPPSAEAPQSEPDLLPALRIIRKHWRLSLGFALAVVACVTAFVFLAKPIYEPSAVIQLDSGDRVFSLQATESRVDPVQFADTQVKNLQGRELAVSVIRKLHLADNAEWLGKAASASGGNSATSGSDNAGQQELSHAEYKALEKFKKALKVERDGASLLIKVSFAAHDPQLAALVANTVVDSFIQREYQSRNDEIAQSTIWLSKQLDDIRASMNESNRELADFQKSSGITAAANSINSYDERMAELNRQLTVAQSDRIQLQALLDKANAAVNVAQVGSDPAVQELTKKLDTTRADLKQALVLYGTNHPKVRELQAQVDELQAELKAQQNRVMSTLKTSFATANARESLLNGEIKSASSHLGQVAQYEALKKTADANEALYSSLYAKVKEAAISAEAKNSNVRWVEHAPILDKPTYPKRGLDIAGALAAGLIGGLLLAFARESIDNRIHTIDDVRFSTGLPSVSLVPLMAGTDAMGARSRRKSLQSGTPVLLERPNSPEADALRGLFTSVTLSMPGREPQVILIASSAPGEGKTTIAVNLAIALSRIKRTCLIDADLRKPGLDRILGVEHPHGLAELLCDSTSLEEALATVPGIPNLTLLPVGPVSGSPGELLTAERMARVLQDLRQQFDSVVVDSPPIIPYADARAISPLVDGVIVVGRSGVTTRDAIKRSVELLREVHSAPVLDVVLNAVPHTSPDYGYHYGYTMAG
jgi:polysaccharide biosynthesis transport protein